jgi:photosystem II stability/assembly factor-like uncharacterized protein
MGKATCICVLVLASLSASACNLAGSEGLAARGPTPSPSPSPRPFVERRSTVEAEGPSPSSWREHETGAADRLSAIAFSDADHGWAAGEAGSLYRTTDGGQTWERLDLAAPPGTHVNDVFFSNASNGWAVLVAASSDVLDYQANKAWLRYTNDGGRSWATQFNADAAALSRVRFVNEQEGWAVGTRYLMRDTMQSDLLVLHTADGGAHWEDVSASLNAAVARAGISDGVVDVYAAQPASALLLTSIGRVVKTVDGGRSWNKLSEVSDPYASTVLSHLGVSDGEGLWIIGGADSKEGMWGELTQLDAQGSATTYKASGVIFRDALFLEGKRVIACGSAPSPGAKAFGVGGRRDGVILLSTDAGNHWTFVYRSSRSRSINALASAGAGGVWAAGDEGLLLRLESPFGRELDAP